MIDIENYVFDAVARAVRAEFPGINAVSRTVLTPSEFPCVSVTEADSYVYEGSIDSGGIEHHAWLMYEVNVFSNRKTGAKEECRAIFKTVDRVMAGMGFLRTGRTPVREDEPTQYRLAGRYRGVADENKDIYVR